MPEFNKLVRDGIIDKSTANGERAIYHMATDEEFRIKLYEKLREEIEEFIRDENTEEMADVFEVIHTILLLHDWTIEDIVKVQEEKRRKRGGFTGKVILERTEL